MRLVTAPLPPPRPIEAVWTDLAYWQRRCAAAEGLIIHRALADDANVMAREPNTP
jgi:hypothetical protein